MYLRISEFHHYFQVYFEKATLIFPFGSNIPENIVLVELIYSILSQQNSHRLKACRKTFVAKEIVDLSFTVYKYLYVFHFICEFCHCRVVQLLLFF